MIQIKKNVTVFDVPVQTIVNAVNCVGVMGKGLALEIKNRFPEVFSIYKTECQKRLMKIGHLQLVKANPQWVLNFPTKNHWRGKSQFDFIEQGLETFQKTYAHDGITSVAFPALGCGHGGLDWERVRPSMLKYLQDMEDVDVFICLGTQTRETAQLK